MTLWVTLWPVLSCHLVRSPSPRPRHPASPTAELAAGAGALTLLAASGEVTGALLRFYLLTESISYQKFTKAIVGSPFLNYNTLVRKELWPRIQKIPSLSHEEEVHTDVILTP